MVSSAIVDLGCVQMLECSGEKDLFFGPDQTEGRVKDRKVGVCVCVSVVGRCGLEQELCWGGIR